MNFMKYPTKNDISISNAVLKLAKLQNAERLELTAATGAVIVTSGRMTVWPVDNIYHQCYTAFVSHQLPGRDIQALSRAIRGCIPGGSGERLNGIQEVSGSIPLISTKSLRE